MWTTVLVAFALAHAGQTFVMNGLHVPSAPEYGSTVTLETRYRLDRGEFINKMKWYKDGDVFLTYAERPEKFLDWTPIPGVNVNKKASSHRKVVLTDVGDEASGQYTLEVQVYGPGGSVNNIINTQSMNVGGVDTIGNRFNGNSFSGGSSFVGGGGGGGGGTFSQSANFGPGFPFNNFQGPYFGPGFPFNNFQGPYYGPRFPFNNFQSSSAGGNTAFQSSGTGGNFQNAGGAFQGTGDRGNFQSSGGAFQSSSPGGNFQSSSAGGSTAFQSSTPGGNFQSAGGAFQGTGPDGTFIQSSTSGDGTQSVQTSFSGSAPGPLGTRSSFQSASSSGEAGPAQALAVQTALAQAQAQVQNAVDRVNQLQALLAGLG